MMRNELKGLETRALNLVPMVVANPAPEASDQFGQAVTAVGGDFVVAAYYDDPGGVASAGSVYLYAPR